MPMMRLYSLAALCLLSLSAAAAQSGTSVAFNDLAKKAEAGDAEAQVQLGRAYEEGNGVLQSDESAVRWYRKSAEQGNANAENSLGVMYALGRGVPRDKEEALRWYKKAAKQGLPEADFNVAVCYYNGDGVASDLNRAYAWMVIAKRHGSSSAEQALPQISHDLQGHLELATLFLAQLYEKGDETPKDPKGAFDIYFQEANSDPRSVRGTFKLCQFYGTGIGVSKDLIQARSWCKKAARNGNEEAYVILGRMAENGVGEERNLKEAEEWYRDAAWKMAPEGFMSMGRLKLQSSSHEDQREAYYWYYLASLYKIPEAAEQAQKAGANLSSSEVAKAQKKAIEWSRTPHWKQPRP